MIDVTGKYCISIEGFGVSILVTHYSPGLEGEYSRKPEDCYPAESAEIDWKAATGNMLLNLLIDDCIACDAEHIETQLFNAIADALENDEFDRAEAKYDVRKESS